jgi:hypothetical protein
MRPDNLPARVGPVELSPFGAKWAAVRCPHDFDALMQRTGGLWEAGSRRWLINRRRLNPLIRTLRRETDPLFRRAGIDLDGPAADGARRDGA